MSKHNPVGQWHLYVEKKTDISTKNRISTETNNSQDNLGSIGKESSNGDKIIALCNRIKLLEY